MRVLIIFLSLLAFAPACSKESAPAATGGAEIPTVSVDELDRLLAERQCVPVDANGETTRAKLGVIPGAVLLSDYETFAASELPADKAKTLVFYCANESCGASEEAAKKARLAGYTRVKVLPAGIAGWVNAGKSVDKG